MAISTYKVFLMKKGTLLLKISIQIATFQELERKHTIKN